MKCLIIFYNRACCCNSEERKSAETFRRYMAKTYNKKSQIPNVYVSSPYSSDEQQGRIIKDIKRHAPTSGYIEFIEVPYEAYESREIYFY